MNNFTRFFAFGAAALLLLSNSLHAAWQLVNDGSVLNFVTVKKGTTAEVGRFTQLSGTLDTDGTVTVAINLASVDTRISVRDQRMRELLFETKLFPQATLTAAVDMKLMAMLKPGESKRTTLTIDLSLHGQKKPLEAVLQITALAGGRLLVTTTSPIIVSAADFGLEQGILKLREIAKLPSIATVVPVYASLVFEKQQ